MGRRRIVFACLVTLCVAIAASAQDGRPCEPIGWGRFIDPGPQTFDVIEQTILGKDSTVTTVVFDDLKGEFAKLFLFAHFVDDCLVDVISVGSYAFTNMSVPDGSRVYHIDYYAKGYHATLEMARTPPDRNDTKALAMELFADPSMIDGRASSSTTLDN